MLIDCHSHSEFSSDAGFSVADMLGAAVRQSVEVFTITDHCDIDLYERDDLAHTVPNSIHAIEAARASSPIPLLTGIELGQPLSNLPKAQYVLDSHEFDFVIGSIHALKSAEDFYGMDYTVMSDGEIETVLQKYYEEVYDLVKWNKFDSLAHITYPYRYLINAKLHNAIKVERFDELAAQAFRLLIQNGKAIENNSSSFLKSEEDYRLNYHYMKLYHDLGGSLVTVGSDAHFPDAVGRGIRQGYAFLKEIGFSTVTYFENRKPIQVLI